jgi:RNA polymerase sigma factor (TIGR02999 family)
MDAGPHGGEIGALIERSRAGDGDAARALFDRLHGELRALAASVFRSQRAGHTLQPTALVHEAFVKMMGARGAPSPWQDEAHFFAVAATAMRQILVNHARDRAAQKRGGGDARRVTLSDVPFAAEGGADVLDVEQALAALEAVDPEQARIVELRSFGGLTNPQIAEVVGRPLRTVELEWRLAKEWLASHLEGHGDG